MWPIVTKGLYEFVCTFRPSHSITCSVCVWILYTPTVCFVCLLPRLVNALILTFFTAFWLWSCSIRQNAGFQYTVLYFILGSPLLADFWWTRRVSCPNQNSHPCFWGFLNFGMWVQAMVSVLLLPWGTGQDATYLRERYLGYHSHQYNGQTTHGRPGVQIWAAAWHFSSNSSRTHPPSYLMCTGVFVGGERAGSWGSFTST